MNIFNDLVDVKLDTKRFVHDEETMAVAIIVSQQAEKCRAKYRKKEAQVVIDKEGNLGYWSQTSPWYDWITDPESIDICASKCGLTNIRLAEILAYQIKPINWLVFAWMNLALQTRSSEANLLSSLKLNQDSASVFNASLRKLNQEQVSQAEKRRLGFSKGGIKSGKTRVKSALCNPIKVESDYKKLLAQKVEKKYVAKILAERYGVSADYVRAMHKKSNRPL